MNTSRIAVIAAATSLVAWIAKATAIGIAGGLDRSPLESPLFLVGLAANIVAVIAGALSLTRQRPAVVRVGATIGAIVAVLGLVTALNLVIQRLQPADASWVWAETNLWVVAALVLGLAFFARRRTETQAAALHR